MISHSVQDIYSYDHMDNVSVRSVIINNYDHFTVAMVLVWSGWSCFGQGGGGVGFSRMGCSKFAGGGGLLET